MGLFHRSEDAYLHIPIRPQDSQFLHFIYDGTVYEFTALPFGFATSPRVFTQMVKTIAAYLCRQNILIFQYLDDWLIISRSHEEVLSATQLICDLTTQLGFIVN